MTYSYVCDGTPLSNLRSLSQTRFHYDRGGDEKSDRATRESDRDPARDHSSHPFYGRHHLCVSYQNICRVSFSLSPIFTISVLSFLLLSLLSLLSFLFPAFFILSVFSPPSPFSPSPFARVSHVSLARPPLALHGWYLLQLFSQVPQAFRC